MAITEHRLRQITERAERAREDRDELIRLASEQGMTRRKVAAATGLSFGRIQQIVSAAMAVVLVMLVGVGSAEASTQVVAEDSSPDLPYQEWIDHSQVPTPNTTVMVTENKGPCPLGAFACLSGDDPTHIYFTPSVPLARWWFRHEIGHTFDVLHLTNARRIQYQRLVHRPGVFPVEAFANSYADCATSEPRKRQGRRICRLIRRTPNG